MKIPRKILVEQLEPKVLFNIKSSPTAVGVSFARKDIILIDKFTSILNMTVINKHFQKNIFLSFPNDLLVQGYPLCKFFDVVAFMTEIFWYL